MSNSEKSLLVTGGCGFIGSHFVRQWLRNERSPVVNLDLLTYAGNPESLFEAGESPLHTLVRGDICDAALLRDLFERHRPRAVVHFAAESHVDRSIHGPEAFVRTNVLGTFHLLDATRNYWAALPETERSEFRFLHVSTDEVFGSLGMDSPAFSETTPYAPNSPYSASKAGSDHLVRAWFHTFGLPVLTTNCTNNYGPAQFPEKLIPHVVLKALEGSPLPVYGRGENVRDWLFVGDHCSAIRAVLERGVPGQTYCIGGNAERANIDVVKGICRVLDDLCPMQGGLRHESLIAFVADRPGHDLRYAMDISKISSELGWRPEVEFEAGLEQTVRWYLENSGWIERVRSGAYLEWVEKNYSTRSEVGSVQASH